MEATSDNLGCCDGDASQAGARGPGDASDMAVASRYAAAAKEVEPALCCPVRYDASLLASLPQEIIDKDYGCGDPSAHVRPGDTVLDLGSGGGKLCYIASQIVGAEGKVIGVDSNLEMLALARKYLDEMAEKLGHANVVFHYGRIQDLQLSLDRLNARLDSIQNAGEERPLALLNLMRTLRTDQPMIADNSVDCVISNCVLNLVHPEDRRALFGEIHRVLKPGGRVAISDIVADEDVPLEMQRDDRLWSGCISGAWREDRLVQEFADAGFYGMALESYQTTPWRVVAGIEFRSVTLVGFKGVNGACRERNQAVIYRGPFSQICDDDGHVYRRGERTAVCDQTYQRLCAEPYRAFFIPVPPREEVPVEDAAPFDCTVARLRLPQETKGAETKGAAYRETSASKTDGDCCCS